MALAARRTGRPFLVQLQDVEFKQHGGPFEELGKVACIANSRFTAEKYNAAYGVEPTVISPFVDEASRRFDRLEFREIKIDNRPQCLGRCAVLLIVGQCVQPGSIGHREPRNRLRARIERIAYRLLD